MHNSASSLHLLYAGWQGEPRKIDNKNPAIRPDSLDEKSKMTLHLDSLISFYTKFADELSEEYKKIQ